MHNSEIEILLVEDNFHDAELTIRALRKTNITNKIIHLKDGIEAIEFLHGNGKQEEKSVTNMPKLILLDLNMPKLDGLEVLKLIKENPKTKIIPVIILTSSKESPDIQKAFLLGANSYLVKPVAFEGFLKSINDIGYYWLISNQHIA
ncbi:MAG: response regulator [Bacteroidota bacterium]